jgi:hypothetical protein
MVDVERRGVLEGKEVELARWQVRRGILDKESE